MFLGRKFVAEPTILPPYSCLPYKTGKKKKKCENELLFVLPLDLLKSIWEDSEANLTNGLINVAQFGK